jgi:hypothetical protein
MAARLLVHGAYFGAVQVGISLAVGAGVSAL